MTELQRHSIGIDGYNLAMPHGTGIATYGRMLVQAVHELGYTTTGIFGVDPGSSRELAPSLFYDRFVTPATLNRGRLGVVQRWVKARISGYPLIDIPPASHVVTDALADRLPAFDRIVTSARLFERAHRWFRRTGRFISISLPVPPTIMHWTYPIPLRVDGSRNIYTIHDLVPLRLPFTTRDDKAIYHALVKRCILEADQICTVSEASRHDIETLFPSAAGKVVNTYQVSGLIKSTGSLSPAANAATRAFGLEPDEYFLYFGAAEPKKNLGRLLEAYLGLDTMTPLVIVSGRSWQDVDELALLGADYGKKGRRRNIDRIIRIDHLRTSLLSNLVASARVVTFPSLYEGFGLPVHEAMLLGAPVLTSTTSSLPEIAGDAAVLVDPYDVESIRKGLAVLDGDSALRDRLRIMGRRRAEGFSMHAYTERLARLYNAARANRPMAKSDMHAPSERFR